MVKVSLFVIELLIIVDGSLLVLLVLGDQIVHVALSLTKKSCNLY